MDALQTEILAIRTHLLNALARAERILNSNPPMLGGLKQIQAQYRVGKHGTLSALGLRELRRRFVAGEPDSIIAREMGLTRQAISLRRADFNNRPGAPRRPGALRGKIRIPQLYGPLPPDPPTPKPKLPIEAAPPRAAPAEAALPARKLPARRLPAGKLPAKKLPGTKLPGTKLPGTKLSGKKPPATKPLGKTPPARQPAPARKPAPPKPTGKKR